MSLSYSIVLPAYNEEQTIARAIRETHRVFTLFAKPFEIIVVDDGSLDRTGEAVDACVREISELRFFRHENNLGKGAAVRTGVLNAHGEIILFLDADLSTHPSEFKKCLPLFLSADIVIGSRRVPGARIAIHQPFHRTFGGCLFNLFLRSMTGLPYHDTQCGFKAFHARTAHLFRDLTSVGWMFDVELLLRARDSDHRIVEVPVTWRHGKDSRVRFRDFFLIAKELISISIRFSDTSARSFESARQEWRRKARSLARRESSRTRDSGARDV